jgi:hypothetical protein
LAAQIHNLISSPTPLPHLVTYRTW